MLQRQYPFASLERMSLSYLLSFLVLSFLVLSFLVLSFPCALLIVQVSGTSPAALDILGLHHVKENVITAVVANRMAWAAA